MTNLEIVRTLINDSAKEKFPEDSELIIFLTLNSDNYYLAAAAALRAFCSTLGTSESTTIGKYSERSNVSALLKIADSYEAKAKLMGVNSDGSAIVFDDYVEIAYTEFNTIDIMNNNIIKENI